MSWSVSRVGKAKAVAVQLAIDLAKIKCSEPEEAIKELFAQQVALALAAYPESSAVAVSASGSQSPTYDGSGSPNGGHVNNLNVKIDPLYGFIE